MGPDRLRTCKPAAADEGAGPFIAIQMQLITRKAWAACRPICTAACWMQAEQAIPGLYCVGEAAGFGGSGASGKRSLEGTFLPGCILTAKAAANHIKSGLWRFW